QRVADHDRARAIQQQIDAALGRRSDASQALADAQLAQRLANALAQRDAARQRLDHLAALVQAREQSRAELIPLLERMLGLLEVSIEHDLPASVPARLNAVRAARDLLSDADAGAADRIAAVLDIYRTEGRLASTINTDAGRIVLGTPARQHRLVRLGRIALYAVTDDGRNCKLYQRDEQRWQPLDPPVCSALLSASADDLFRGLEALPLSSTPDTPP
ncbi:MAG: DUF3450 family protein, partial [Pseudomonadota bacterium]